MLIEKAWSVTGKRIWEKMAAMQKKKIFHLVWLFGNDTKVGSWEEWSFVLKAFCACHQLHLLL